MKNVIIAVLVIFSSGSCSQNKTVTPLAQMDAKTIKKIAEAELLKVGNLKVDRDDSLSLLIAKANELKFCDSLIEIESKGDSESRDISLRLGAKLNEIRNYRGLRILYAVAISRYLTKKYGYETFAKAWWGDDPCTHLTLMSDGFDKNIAENIYQEIKPQLLALDFEYIFFTSKTQCFSGYYKSWKYIQYGGYELPQVARSDNQVHFPSKTLEYKSPFR